MALAVAQCGPRLWTLDKGPRLVSCRLDALGRGAGGAPAGGSELHCLPCLPAALGEGAVVALAASGAQDALVVASASAVAVVRLPAGTGAGAADAGKLSGSLWRDSTRGGAWRLSLRSLQGVQLEAQVAERAAKGSLSGAVGRRSGELSLALEGGSSSAAGAGAPLRAGEWWSGRFAAAAQPGSGAQDFRVRLSVESVTAGTEGVLRVHASLGAATVTVLEQLAHPVMDAQWHPLLKGQLVVLTRDGTVRVYDAAGGEGGCALLGSQRLGEPGSSFVAMAFGAGVADRVGRCGSLALLRRMSLFAMTSTGAVLRLCPVGAFGPQSADLRELRAALAVDVAAADGPNARVAGALRQQLRWVDDALQPATSDGAEAAPRCRAAHPLLVARAAVCPCERPGGQGVPPQARRQHQACSLAVLPSPDSPTVTLLRAWSCGRVDSLFGGGLALPQLVDYKAGTGGGGGGGGAALAVARLADRRDSPLRDLAGKINASAAQSPLPAFASPKSPSLVQHSLARQGTPRSAAAALLARGGGGGRGGGGRGRQLHAEDEGGQEEEEEEETLVVAPGQIDAPAVLDSQNPARLVGCTEIVPGSKLWLEADPVYAEHALCVDEASGTAHLLYLPWIGPPPPRRQQQQQGGPRQDQQPDPELLGRLLAMPVPGTTSGPGRARRLATVAAEPGVGHLLLAAAPAGRAGVLAGDLSALCVQLRASLALDRKPSSDARPADGDAAEEELEELEELDVMASRLRQQLKRLTSIPDQLGAVKVGPADGTPPALGLAVAEWLRQVSDGLTYGNGKEAGLMQVLRAGMQLVERRREEQNDALRLQAGAIYKIHEDLKEAARGLKDADALAGKGVKQQAVPAEGLACADAQAAAAHAPPSGAEQRFAQALEALSLRAATLAERLGVAAAKDDDADDQGNTRQTQGAAAGKLAGRVDALLAGEAELRALPPPGRAGLQQQLEDQRAAPAAQQEEVELHLRDLQARTAELLGRMVDPSGDSGRTGSRHSVAALRRRLQDLRAACAATAAAKGAALVTLVALEPCAAAEALRAAVEQQQQHGLQQLWVHPRLLSREHQAAVRRRLGLGAALGECPYSVPFQHGAGACGGGAASVDVVLLDEGCELRREGDRLRLLPPPLLAALAGGDDWEEAAAGLLEDDHWAASHREQEEQEPTQLATLLGRRSAARAMQAPASPSSAKLVRVTLVAFQEPNVPRELLSGVASCAEPVAVAQACEAMTAAAALAPPLKVL